MCTWMAMETVSYFLERGTNVYACSMDYSKAFDRVLHGKLFDKMESFLIRFTHFSQIVNVHLH